MLYISKIVWSLFLFLTLVFTGCLSALDWATQHDPFILTPIPKAGTHLIMRCINLMTHKGVVGLMGGTPQDLERSLEMARQQNAIMKCHHVGGGFFNVLRSQGYKNIFVCRDPRDACVSLVIYMDEMTGKNRDFYVVPDEWDSLSFDDKLFAVIKGIHCESYVGFWFDRLTYWTNYPDTLVVRFEDLVGNNGGGSDQVQMETLQAIANFTHMNISQEGLERVANELYNPSTKPKEYNGITYLGGQIGNWRLFFNEKHKKAFKKKYNHLLIRFNYENNSKW